MKFRLLYLNGNAPQVFDSIHELFDYDPDIATWFAHHPHGSYLQFDCGEGMDWKYERIEGMVENNIEPELLSEKEIMDLLMEKFDQADPISQRTIFTDILSQLNRLEKLLHEKWLHPDYEYEVTKGPRKAWDNQMQPPEGEGWEINRDVGRDGWERYDFHEEMYWKRKKVQKEGE